MYRSKLKEMRYPELGHSPADYILWRSMVKKGVPMSFLDRVDSIHLSKGANMSKLGELYFKIFNKEFREEL